MKNPVKPNKLVLPHEFPGVIWYDQEEIDSVIRVMRNKSPFRYYGPNCNFEAEKFESEFARYIVSKPNKKWPDLSPFMVTAVNSGTGALEIALDALGVGCGDEVLVQGFMWIASISAIIRNRAIPVLVDSDDTLNMDPKDLRKKISARTKVIIPVPMLGASAKIGEIMEVVREINENRIKHNLKPIRVLEDCAQSIGAYAKGIPGSINQIDKEDIYRLGTFGDIGIFSMQINKGITAGEGGIIITRDIELHKQIEALHNVGYIKDPSDKSNTMNWYGNVPLAWGQGRRITEIQAAIGRIQIKKLDSILESMRKSHNTIEEFLNKIGLDTRLHADSENPGDTGYYCIFRLPFDELSDEQKIIRGRKISKFLGEYGLNPWFLHDFEVHIYYNIPTLINKVPINNGCPWECPNNQFHKIYSYERGTLPKLDKLLTSSVGINVPSKLTEEHEKYIMEVLGYVNDILIKK